VTDLTRKQGSALWHQVESALAEEIEAGVLRMNDRLPTEPALMRRFGVSRFTVRHAIAALERRGLVRAEQGRGTFVQHDRLQYPISRRTRFSRNLIEQGLDPGGELITHEIIPAPATASEALRLRPHEPVVHRRGIGTANGMPVELGSIYLPSVRFPDLERMRREHVTWTATFAAYGIADYVRTSTIVETRMPTPEEARLLRQPKSVPVLLVRRVDCDLAGHPFAYGVAAWAGERVAFELSEPG
jgi:GntR family transcriptional regulator, phosphonate transport system regulatory protein